MNIDFLSPIKDTIVAHSILLPPQSLGKSIHVHTMQEGVPDLEGIQLAILGVKEDRNSFDNFGSGEDLDKVRKYLYQLFPGNWHTKIADLGNIEKGNSVTDTYFAVSNIVESLLKKNIIPIIIGGTQDITYANYRAYDNLEQTVNLVSVDSRFDIGSMERRINF